MVYTVDFVKARKSNKTSLLLWQDNGNIIFKFITNKGFGQKHGSSLRFTGMIFQDNARKKIVFFSFSL